MPQDFVKGTQMLVPAPFQWRDSRDQRIAELTEQRDELLAALLKVARMAENLKRDCGLDPESPQAIRNAHYMNISYAAREAIAKAEK